MKGRLFIRKLIITTLAMLILEFVNLPIKAQPPSLISSPSTREALYAISQKGMVVSSQHLATQVGVDILKKGGNAIDAAVAVGYALSVVHPCCNQLGGSGFMLIHLVNGHNVFLNFREKAPSNSEQLRGKSTLTGYLSVGIPGLVMGLNTALEKYGTLTLKEVMAPAIKLARNGFVLREQGVCLLRRSKDNLSKQPNVATIFLVSPSKKRNPQIGDQLTQADLANSLTQIAKEGSHVFYHGNLAKVIVTASQQHGGLFTLKDFADYTVETLSPITCNYKGYHIISAPPPSSGGVTLCEMLNILKGYPNQWLKHNSISNAHYLIEAMRFAFADRNTYLGDPNFVHNPVKHLLSDEHAEEIRKKIKKRHAAHSKYIGFLPIPIKEGQHTTHYSIADRFGNYVSTTVSLNSFFGAKVMPQGTGILLNNSMNDFTLTVDKPNIFGLKQGVANLVASGKRPLSSMMPTIVTKNNQVIWVLGTPGGPTIITQILLVLHHLIDQGMTLSEAVAAPRFHMQWLPDVVYIEPHVFSKSVMKGLTHMGYSFIAGLPFKQSRWGGVAAIYHDVKTGKLEGVSDPRRLDALSLGP